LILSVAMLALFSLIVTSVILVAIIVIDQPVWRVASMAAISLGLLFLASASKLRPIGRTVALIVAFALDELGTVHGGEIATRALLYVWLFVGIPAGVSICVNLLLAPSPRFLAEQALARRLRLAAAKLGASGRHRHKARLHRMFARGKWRIAKMAEIKAMAKKQGADIYFGDAAHIRSDHRRVSTA
jgi:multidrug resistance protein MdtO